MYCTVPDTRSNLFRRHTPVMEGTVDKTIARLNIEHYRRKLLEEKDEGKRQTLARLLAEEEEKLARLSKPKDSKSSG
jgi:hypothetical protein